MSGAFRDEEMARLTLIHSAGIVAMRVYFSSCEAGANVYRTRQVKTPVVRVDQAYGTPA